MSGATLSMTAGDYSFADLRSRYRRLSRRVFAAPTVVDYHKQRIIIASEFKESEPLQGALADYFFAGWYNVIDASEEWFAQALQKLPREVRGAFLTCLTRQSFVQDVSDLATRWSVLISPSMDVSGHKLMVSRDDAFFVSANFGSSLIDARESGDWDVLTSLEQEFFAHCLACQDRMAFIKLWFRLSKHDWDFHDGWLECQSKLNAAQ